MFYKSQVGALIACLFAKRDHKVRIYEYRPGKYLSE